MAIGALLAAAGARMGAQDPAIRGKSDTLVLRVGPSVHRGVGTLTEELSIGTVDGGEEYTFGSIRDIAVAEDGSILVADAGAKVVRRFDQNGRHLQTIGRQGGGPGEYDSPTAVAVHKDGRILVYDAATTRINAYSKAGTPLQQLNVPVPVPEIASGTLRVDTAGRIYVRTRVYLPGAERLAPIARMHATLLAFVRLRADGSVIDTITVPDSTLDSTVAMSGARVPFMPDFLSELSPLGYFVTAVSNRYSVDLRVPPTRAAAGTWKPGDAIVSIRHAVAPVRVQDAERADWRRAIEVYMRSGNPRWAWTGPEIPSVKPPLRSLGVDEDGRIWVWLSTPATLNRSAAIPVQTRPGQPRRNVANERWPETSLADVLEPSGRYVGRVRFETPISALVIRGDYVWGVARDADGVQFVKRYHIVWPD